MRAFRLCDPETAHRGALCALRLGLVPPLPPAPDSLATEAFGRRLASPVGIAAGLDKDGEAMAPLLALGAGFVEIGAVTPRPQPGNPKPRLFRLTADRAVINRFGFNSAGHAVVAERLAAFRRYSRQAAGVVGVNLGMNKDSTDPAADYEAGVRAFAPHADFVTVNVSSPNTAGLRDLQQEDSLLAIAGRARAALAAMPGPCRLMVKLAPDLSDEAAASLVRRMTEAGLVDGWIVSNTTIARPDSLRSPNARETGGLSGPPVFQRSTELLRVVWQASGGGFVIGAGGVSDGATALAKIRAGASLLQLYTAMVYDGPGVIGRIHAELAALLARDGFARVADAVAADHR
ncbi:MAG: quinone-dependent dihydroorotate dehydrogenase [Alphaproteobacteria bacterium]|nr:quinone-dependent dihydroorotate dehydrogenase [Alphaproteobacteria bacterium]